MRIWSSSRIENEDSPLRKTVTIEFESYEAVVIEAALNALLHDEAYLDVALLEPDMRDIRVRFMMVANIMFETLHERLIASGITSNGDTA